MLLLYSILLGSLVRMGRIVCLFVKRIQDFAVRTVQKRAELGNSSVVCQSCCCSTVYVSMLLIAHRPAHRQRCVQKTVRPLMANIPLEVKKKKMSRKTFIRFCGRQVAVFRMNVASQRELPLLLRTVAFIKVYLATYAKADTPSCSLYILYCVPSGCLIFVSCLPACLTQIGFSNVHRQYSKQV